MKKNRGKQEGEKDKQKRGVWNVWETEGNRTMIRNGSFECQRVLEDKRYFAESCELIVHCIKTSYAARVSGFIINVNPYYIQLLACL